MPGPKSPASLESLLKSPSIQRKKFHRRVCFFHFSFRYYRTYTQKTLSLTTKKNLFFRKNISQLTDEELLAHYTSSGNTEYFGVLYNRYIPLLYGLCLKYLKNEDQAQEAVMQLFEELMAKVQQYQISLFRPWLYRVAKNHCLQLLRKDKKGIVLDYTINIVESDEFLHLLSEEESQEEQWQALQHCLKRLSDEQRSCIIRFFLKEMSYADIAKQTGWTLSNIKSFIQNGKRNLKICIKKQQLL